VAVRLERRGDGRAAGDARLRTMAEDVKIRESEYKDPRPAELFMHYHERAREREPDFVYDTTRLLVSPYMYVVLRTRALGIENLPGAGPVILAPNHFSFLDHFLVGCYTRRRTHFMAKSQLFKGPFAWVLEHGAAYPVRRGYQDEEAFITTRAILERGGTVTMYCEGKRSRTGKLADTARPGIGRIALESGAPVVPTAVFGSSKVRNWRRGRFPRVTVQFGEPIAWEQTEDPTREQQQVVADEILTQIRAMYDGLARYGRKAVERSLREKRRSRRTAVA